MPKFCSYLVLLLDKQVILCTTLLFMMTSCGKKTVIKNVLEDEDLPNVTIDLCTHPAPEAPVTCQYWNAKKLEYEGDAALNPSPTNLEYPRFSTTAPDFASLKRLLFALLKPIYRWLHTNYPPDKFDNLLDTM